MANRFDNCSQFSGNELGTRTPEGTFKLYLGTGLNQPLMQQDPCSGVISKSGCTFKVPLNAKTCSRTLLWADWILVSRPLSEFPEPYHSFRPVVTTFELARDDIEQLCDQHWSCIVVDEVHRVKNPKSRTSKTLNMFQCPVRLGLTGAAPAGSSVCTCCALIEGKSHRHCHPKQLHRVLDNAGLGKPRGARDVERMDQMCFKATGDRSEQTLERF